MAGNTKTFFGFASINKNIKMTRNFLGNNENATIFSLYGKIWGYDLTLFNYFGEEEILLEPERKFYIEEIIPEVNGIIFVRGEFKETSLALHSNLAQDSLTLKY